MRQQYDLDAQTRHLLTALENPAEAERTDPALEEEPATIHIYPVAGGGILFSPIPLDQEEPLIIESQPEPDTEIPWTRRPTPTAPAREPLVFLHFLLILSFFVLFDIADSQVSALLAPIATVAITPQVQTLATTATLSLASLQGRVLPALTLAQMQNTQATGHGHQDAQRARGTLILYNGLFTSQSIPVGTIFPGGNGVQVATDAAVTIAAGAPPNYAVASVPAHALQAGSRGNIGAGEVNTTVANGVLVENTPFTGGSDARDFVYVTRADIQQGTEALTPSLVQGEQAALAAHLRPHEVLSRPICTTQIAADHHPGAEATHVQVTMSQTCSAVAYNKGALLHRATVLLSIQAFKRLGAGYSLLGNIQVTVSQATVAHTTQSVIFSVTCVGTWVYVLSETAQQHIKTLIAGRTKQDALQLLLSQNGIASVTIAGIPDTKKLPDDLTHIHLFIIVER